MKIQRCYLIMLPIAIALAHPSRAADTAWQYPSGGTGNWLTPANWTGAVGLPSTANRATFNTNTATTITLSANAIAGSAAFNNGVTTFDFGTSTLTAGNGTDLWQLGGVANRTGVTMELKSGTISGVAALRIGGAAGSAGNIVKISGGAFNMAATGDIYVGYAAGSAELNITGSGSLQANTLRIDQVGTSSGNNSVTVNGANAKLTVGGNSTLGLIVGARTGSGSNTLTVSNGGKVDLSGILAISTDGNSNSLTIRDNGSSFTQAYTGGGTGASLRIGSAAATNSSLNIEGGSFTSDAIAQVYQGTGNMLNVTGGTASFTGSSLTLDGQIKQTGGDLRINHLIVSSSGTFDFKSGAMTLTSGAFSNSTPVEIGDGVSSTATLKAAGGTFGGAGAILINSNGNLVGSGSFNNTGGVTINGTISPGDSAGSTETLSFKELTLGSSANITLELTSLDYDKIRVTDQLTLNGTIAVSLFSGFNPADKAFYQLFEWGTLDASGFDLSNLILPELVEGLSWNTANFLSNGSISVIPEPGTVMLMLIGLGVAFRAARRGRGV